jgi:peroxiredoxin
MNKLALALLIGLTLSACNSKTEHDNPETTPAATPAAKVAALDDTSQKGPEFSLPNINGGSIKSSDLKGKVVIVDFWQTDCEPCIEEVPEYNELYNKYKAKGVEFVGVTLDSGGADEIKPLAKKIGMQYPIVVGDEKVVHDFGGIFGTPTTFVLGPNWTIHHKYLGPKTKESLEKDIQDLLPSSEGNS